MNWYKSESTVRPDEVDTTSSNKVVYLRRNIVEKQRDDKVSSENVTTYYEYDEAKLTKEEYEKYLKSLDLINIQQLYADLDYVAAMAGVEL